MGVYTLLQKRETGYYFRQFVPTDLQSQVGKKEIVKSLKTKIYGEATKRHKEFTLECEKYFESLRKGLNPSKAPDVEETSSKSSSEQHKQPAKGKDGRTLEWLAEEWIKQKANNVRRKKDAGLVRRVTKLFTGLHKGITIDGLKPIHIMEFRRFLIEDSSLGISSSTKNIYVDEIKKLTSFAQQELIINENPFQGLKTKIDGKDKIERLPFSSKQLEKIFLNKEYKGFKDSHPERYWIPVIGLFTGARLEEIAQFHVQDLKSENDIWYFDMNTFDSDKHLKNEGSKRKIPIHNELLRLGLIEYLDSVKSSKYIFSGLAPHGHRRSHNFSKWFSRYKTKLGFDSRYVFHSFRHTFKDLCRDADIPEEVHHRLTGHTFSDVGGKYGYGHSLAKLNEHLQKIKSPISFESYYTGKAKVLNPASEPAKIKEVRTKQAPEPINPKDMLNAVSLAEAYQRIGKAHFKDKWQDYENFLYHNGAMVKTSLTEYLELNHDRTAEEFPVIESAKINHLTRKPATKVELDRHWKIRGYLFKGLMNGGLKAYMKSEGKPYATVQHEDWMNLESKENDLLLSQFHIRESNDKVLVLVNKESLEKYVSMFG